MAKKYANRCTEDGSILAFEVLEPVSPTEMIICEMDCTLRKGWKPIMLLGNCTNEQEQQWDIEVDPEALMLRIRLTKFGEWKDAQGYTYVLSEIPVRFHRFSFVSGIYDADVEE
jgi:hypothetical protein